jgi:lipid A 3-O-deacylase
VDGSGKNWGARGMLWSPWYIVVAFALSLVAAGPAVADDAVPSPTPFISEVRGGVMYHEDSRLRRVFFNQSKPREDGIFDINGEVLFAPLPFHSDNWFLNFLLTPRPRIGTSINIGNGTSQASAGLAWNVTIWKNIFWGWNLFWEGSLDVAIHNGWTDPTPPPNHLRGLGCSPIFRQSLSMGFEIDKNWRVMGTFEHLDNFGLCQDNQMLSNLGLRVGYRF